MFVNFVPCQCMVHFKRNFKLIILRRVTKVGKNLLPTVNDEKNVSHPKLIYDLPIVIVEIISVVLSDETFVNLANS